MASGDGPKWPGPVTFDDNRPDNGFVTIHLKIPELKVGGFPSKKVKNGVVKPTIKKDHVSVEVNITDGPSYLYDKQMPEDINADKSKHKVKEGKVELVLCKKKDTSWGANVPNLIKKP